MDNERERWRLVYRTADGTRCTEFYATIEDLQAACLRLGPECDWVSVGKVREEKE